MDEKRTLFLISYDGREILDKILLTDDQIRFLNFLQKGNYLEDGISFVKIGKENPPQII